MAQEVPYITIKKNIHAKTSNIDNLVQQQRNLGFPIMKKPSVQEYITIPFPDFCTIYYEITIWTQFESQMNEVIEKIFYNYDHLDSFVMYSEYDNDTKKGDGHRFVGFRDGSITPQSNTEDFSDKERVIKYTYTIKVPTYLILDPKDETLAYGRKHGDSKTDDNSKYVYKSQNPVSVQLKEEIVSSQVVEALGNVGVDVFGNQAQQDQERQNLFNLLSSVQGGGGGGGGTSPTFDTATPQPIALVGAVGASGKIPNSDHVHAHGDLPGGSLHAIVSILSAGFVPALTGTYGDVLTISGSQAKWIAGGSGGTTDISALNAFSASTNIFSQSVNTFSASQNTLNATLNSFTASFSASVKAIGDTRYVLTSSYNVFTGSINGSILTLNAFSQTINTFTASFTSSVQSIGDVRYVLTSSFLPVTGSDNFFVKQVLQVSGSIVNPVGHLILSSSAGSKITVSGSLLVTDTFTLTTRGPVLNDTGHLILTSSAGSQVVVSGSVILKDNRPLIFAPNTDLILSSSRIIVTGTFDVNGGGVFRNGLTVTGGGFVVTGGNTFSIDNAGIEMNGTAEGQAYIRPQINLTRSLEVKIVSTPYTRWNSTANNPRVEFGVPVWLSSSSTGSIIAGQTHLILSSSAGSQVVVSGNLKVQGRITSDTELIFSSSGILSGSRAIYSGSIIIPNGGGNHLSGSGIAIGIDTPYESIHVVNGNIRIEGSGTDLSYIVKNYGLPNFPQFRMGSIILGGDGDPEVRWIYSDLSASERSVFEFDKKGIVASVKPTGSYGSHFEGFMSGEVEPMFRLNSSPSMSFEAGRGSGSWTDAILRRIDIGRFRIHSQLSGGAYVTGNLDVANIYSSDGHLHLSSTFGTVAVSGNLKITNGYVYSDGNLIFSSSVSTTVVSGNLKIAGNGLLYSNNDLLLSSSNSNITLSGNVKLVGQIYNESVPTLTTLSKSVSLDFNRGHSFIINSSGSVTDLTATLSNMKAGNSYIVKYIQGDASYRNLVFTPTPKYSSGTVPVFSSGSGKEDIVTIWYDGVNSYLNFGPWFF